MCLCRHLGLNRCDLGENFVRAMDKALHINTTLMAIEANENGLSLTKLKVLADGTQSNHELVLLWQDPVKYDLTALSGPMQRLVLDKLHFLPLDVIHMMYSNKTIMENEPFQRLVEEMAPPSRKRLVLSGDAFQSKTALAGDNHLKAALFIQRRWRFHRYGDRKLDLQDVVHMKLKEKRRELSARYGVSSYEKHKRARALRETRMPTSAATAEASAGEAAAPPLDSESLNSDAPSYDTPVGFKET